MNKGNIRYIITDVILTWQLIAWVLLIVVTCLIVSGQINVNTIKAGSFELGLDNAAKRLGIYNSDAFKGVKNLDENDLKFFLIMGGRDAYKYTFRDENLTGDEAVARYERLQADSLITYSRLNDSLWLIEQTDVGKKVHKALVKSIYVQLNSGE